MSVGKALYNSASENGEGFVRELLKKANKKDVNWQNEDGNTALMKAASEGLTEIVRLLLDHSDVDVNVQNEKGLTALMKASRNGCIETVRLLLAHSQTKVNVQDADDETALMKASGTNNTEIVRLLLEHPEIDVNLEDEIGDTALSHAVDEKFVDVVRLLVEDPRVDVNLQDEGSETTLMKASHLGDIEIVKLLLANPSVNVNIQDQNSETALMKACEADHSKIVEQLLLHPEIDVNGQDEGLETALMKAADAGNARIVGMLLSHPRIDMNLQDEDQWTALMHAAINGHVNAVKLLVNCPGTDVNARDKDQHTALMQASHMGHTAIVAMLLTHPAIDVNLQNKNLSTALMRASRKGHIESVKSLLDHPGININLLNKNDETAMDLAKNERIASLLRTHVPVAIKSAAAPIAAIVESAKPGEEAPLAFTCAGMPIQNVQTLVSDATSLHGTRSSRLLLRGHFFHVTDTFLGQTSTKYYCVIKCAGDKASYAADSDNAETIRREFAMYENLKESAILKKNASTGCIKCYHMHPSDHYLILESFGQDIQCLLVQPNFKLVTQLAEAIVAAVVALHSLGVMHGDIKPHNILFELDSSHSYVIKLCDLDSAHQVGEVCAARALGTKQYEAPEVYFASRESENVTAALSMDNFPLGIVLWQVLSRTAYSPLSVEKLHEYYAYDNEHPLKAELILPDQFSMYQSLLYGCTALLQPRISGDALYKKLRDISISKAHLELLKVQRENLFLKEKVADRLDGLDKKLGAILEVLQVQFKTLGGEVVGVAEVLRKEILLGHDEHNLVLTSILTATQDAMEGLAWAKVTAASSADHANQILACIQTLQSTIDDKFTMVLQGVSTTGAEAVSGLRQLQESFSEVSAQFENYSQQQSIDAFESARSRLQALELNDSLAVGLQSVVEGIAAVQRDIQKFGEVQEKLSMEVGRILSDNMRLGTMIHTLISGMHTIPTYAIILPVVANSWVSKVNPMRLVRNQYRLYFLCSYTHQIAQCGPKGKGYKITVTKQWVRDAAPVLMAGLIVLKLALNASGIPLPVPDLSPLLNTPALHVKFLDAALSLVRSPIDVEGVAEYMMERTINELASVGADEVMDDIGNHAVSLQEGSLKAYATIQSVLDKDNIDIALSSGLRQVTHPVSGKTAWVLDTDTVKEQYCASVPEPQR
eukprot:CAMPEP_0184971942 /NCGR_PEP_ID=MMETSP1098-20130426/4049_1 /TAXON_ID=89044 /ORGANISM="Spumella elongata, Strain CCAP 955/1" /LENGTH=1168 /DNA_ID=CAMNT_0027494147 /DNA_START=137 /DNA_END=3643 /DNA_ORIENTATION=+